MNNKISVTSKVLLLIASVCLLVSIFVPIWRIELDAPQYPEGLTLQIFSNKLGGDVQIINGLNHYIGMKTLQEDDFIEFTILPYIIGAFALISLSVIFISRKKVLYTLFASFIIFGIIAMADFWRWEYDYGHNLDPHAAIIVPGMAYQPPLVGFKQLLNFGAYSIPDKGGWLFISSGILMLMAVIIEYRNTKKYKVPIVAAMAMLLITSCSPAEPEPIRINADHCEHCKMMISDLRFAAELITDKNRIYKFDDVVCMMEYISSDKKVYSHILISDYDVPNELCKTTSVYFVKSASLKSPMGGNIAAFKNEKQASIYANKWNTVIERWESINPNDF